MLKQDIEGQQHNPVIRMTLLEREIPEITRAEIDISVGYFDETCDLPPFFSAEKQASDLSEICFLLQVHQASPLAAPCALGETDSLAQDSRLHGRVGGQLSLGAFERQAWPTADSHGLLGAHQRVYLVSDASKKPRDSTLIAVKPRSTTASDSHCRILSWGTNLAVDTRTKFCC